MKAAPSQLVVFGVGKIADVLFAHLSASGGFDVVAFTVDEEFMPQDRRFHDRPIVAFEHIETSHPPDRYPMLIAVGYHDLNAVRIAKYEQAKSKGYRLASYVSPRACVGNWLVCGENCIVLDGAAIEPGVQLGNNVVVWSAAHVGHHTVVEDHVWIASHAVFGGSARLGRASFVGLGAVVGHEVEIGERNLLGAGTLVTKCTDPNTVFVAKNTDPFRLDVDRFLTISKLR